MQMSKTPIILGIDPGTQILGFAILKGGTKPALIHMDVLKLTKEKDIYARLQLIHAKIIELIEKYEPAHFAIEAPFFGKNVQSMLKLGRAQMSFSLVNFNTSICIKTGFVLPFKIAKPRICVPGSIPKIMGVLDICIKVTNMMANSELYRQ